MLIIVDYQNYQTDSFVVDWLFVKQKLTERLMSKFAVLQEEIVSRVNVIVNTRCEGCKIDDPSQFNHACCMTTEDEKIFGHFEEVFESLDTAEIVAAVKEKLFEDLLVKVLGAHLARKIYGIGEEEEAEKQTLDEEEETAVTSTVREPNFL